MTVVAALKSRRLEQSSPPEEAPIRLLIVDDSSVARAVMSRMVMAQPGFEVVATASSAAEAIRLLRTVTVDVVMLDVDMPGQSGLEALPAILQAGRGAGILVVSSTVEEGGDIAIRALALGATDAMPKPASGLFGNRFSETLPDRLRRVARNGCAQQGEPAGNGSPVIKLREIDDWQPACIAIGASTGGIHAINEFVGALPPRIGIPIFVTQHLPHLFMPYFARQLAIAARRPARVVEDGDLVEPDAIHVAPGNAHLALVRRGEKVRVKLDAAPAPSGCLPSVDPMLASVGEIYGRGAIAVMLSGMGRDGLLGSGKLAACGGIVLAQDQCSSAIWGMPRAVAEAGLASAVLPPRELARRLAQRGGDAAWK